MVDDDVRKVSPITWYLEKLFYQLQFISYPNRKYGTRSDNETKWRQGGTPEQKQQALRRAKAIEYYTLVWLVSEAMAVVLVSVLPGAWQLFVLIPLGYRVVDILQAVMNSNLFDRLRIPPGPHHVASIERSAILAVWNFFEVCLCFGVFYSGWFATLVGAGTEFPGPYYFSLVTQLTIGYGDLAPRGFTRILSGLQGGLAFVLGLFAVTRFVGLLPEVVPVMPPAKRPAD